LSLSYPIQGGFPVTPSDTADLAQMARGLFVGVAGNVKITYADGTTDTLTNLVAGVWHPMYVKRVYSTGTTATDIHGGI